MLTDKNIVLVRSPSELITDNLAGYGWGQANFSAFDSINAICDYLASNGIVVGRHRNQMKRFYELKNGDVVVIPVHRAIVLGKVQGAKSYGQGIQYGENRVSVNYFKDEQGSVIRIPRSKLSQGLESRLKIRMSIASLNDFRDEITEYVSQLETDNKVCFDSIFQQKKDAAIESFKQNLLSNIVNGNTTLKSGGCGLEQLVKELLEIEGYTAHIEAKNQSSDISDIDITATRNDPVSSNRVFIQVKHHKGNTSDWAVKQLVDIDEDEHHDKWVVTTGRVDDSTISLASEHNIKVMNGEDLIDWVYNRIGHLSPKFKEQLGISILPQIIN
ncbi:restriction endonuclease [Psychrosphaera aestuarii]|uniref:restriction endonuclease n=1 Tax=Psychrosphaera aestuarii TaxID=1266052 RepID=UPI001B334169|nr:restriction endonuclease [Psychrosphaera aestuarii]